MQCGGLANIVLAFSLLFSVAGRLLGGARLSASLLSHKVALEQSSGCPDACSCHTGEPSNGGIALANGMCYDFCSAPQGTAALRYCGRGGEYKQGDYIDCTSCKEAKYFKGSYTLHEPASKAATVSVILLGPFNASSGWGMNWIMNNSEQIDPRIKKESRVLDVVGKQAWWEGHGQISAWYGYADYDQWLKGVPIAPEVDHAISYVHNLIEQEHKIVGDYRRIALIGLHQGGNLALESALRFAHPLGLVFSQRGVLLPARAKSTKAVAATPYVLTAGEKDDVYTEDQIRKDAGSLQAMHTPVFMKTLPGFGHFQWSQEESTLVLKSLAAALTETPVSTNTLAALTDWTVAS